MSRTDVYWIIAGGALIGLLLIGSVAVALTRDEPTFPPGSPEAAALAYVRALETNDLDAIYESLAPALRGECSFDELFSTTQVFDGFLEASQRVSLSGVRPLERRTIVEIEVSRAGGGLFGPNEYSYPITFSLEQVDGEWRFVEWPWPLHSCR